MAVSFLTLAVGPLRHVFVMRPPTSGVLVNEGTRHRYVGAAVGVCVLLLFGAVYSPGVGRVLEVHLPSAKAWGRWCCYGDGIFGRESKSRSLGTPLSFETSYAKLLFRFAAENPLMFFGKRDHAKSFSSAWNTSFCMTLSPVRQSTAP